MTERTTLERPEPERLLTGTFVLLSVLHFFHGLALHLFLHLPGFLRRIGADEVAIGVLFGVMAAAALAARPLVGRWMDTRGRKVVIVSSGALHAAVAFGYLGVRSLGVGVAALRAVHGLAEAMMFASFFTYAADIVPSSRRTQGLAIFGVSGLLPIAVAGLVGDAILAAGTYRDLFLVAGALSTAALAGSLALEDRRPSGPGLEPSRGFVAAVMRRDLVPLWFMGTVFATSLAAVFVFLKTYVLETGVGSVGLFLAAYAVSASLLRLSFSWVPDRYGPKRSLFPTIGILALGLLLLARAATALDVAVAGVFAGLGHGFAFPILAGLVVTRAREADRGSAVSMFTAVFDLGTLLGGPAFGIVVHVASYPVMFLCAAAVAVTGAAVFAVWDRGR